MAEDTGKDTMKITGVFFRKSHQDYPENAETHIGWAIISHRNLPDRTLRRLTHGKWFKIKSANGTIYRALSFNGGLKGDAGNNNSADIVLDWVGWLNLHGRSDNVDHQLNLEIEQCRLWELFMVFCKHPDPFQRLSNIMSIITFFLGLVLGAFFSVLLAPS